MNDNLIKKTAELKKKYNEHLEEIENCKLSLREKKTLEIIIKESIAHESITLDHITISRV